MTQSTQRLCILCRAKAVQHKEYDQDERTLIARIVCSECGQYRVRPQPWTGHERSCLAAYVRHENSARQKVPLIDRNNWQTLARLGAAIRRREA